MVNKSKYPTRVISWFTVIEKKITVEIFKNNELSIKPPAIKNITMINISIFFNLPSFLVSLFFYFMQFISYYSYTFCSISLSVFSNPSKY